MNSYDSRARSQRSPQADLRSVFIPENNNYELGKSARVLKRQSKQRAALSLIAKLPVAPSVTPTQVQKFNNVPKLSAHETSRAASLAKACLSDVYARTTNRAVQMHGGIGFTWEHNMHFWFKRAKWNDFAFGDATYHRERLARLEGF